MFKKRFVFKNECLEKRFVFKNKCLEKNRFQKQFFKKRYVL